MSVQVLQHHATTAHDEHRLNWRLLVAMLLNAGAWFGVAVWIADRLPLIRHVASSVLQWCGI